MGLYGENYKKDPLSSITSQIDNARQRLNAVGVNTDTRNWFEKATNLPQNQNAFFDTLDLIGRPFQTISGAINAGQHGNDIGQGAWKGFSGQKKVYGSDILGDAGVTNKYAKAIGGFGFDLAFDPTTYLGGYIAKPIANVIGKGLGAGVKAIDATKWGGAVTEEAAQAQRQALLDTFTNKHPNVSPDQLSQYSDALNTTIRPEVGKAQGFLDDAQRLFNPKFARGFDGNVTPDLHDAAMQALNREHYLKGEANQRLVDMGAANGSQNGEAILNQLDSRRYGGTPNADNPNLAHIDEGANKVNGFFDWLNGQLKAPPQDTMGHAYAPHIATPDYLNFEKKLPQNGFFGDVARGGDARVNSARIDQSVADQNAAFKQENGVNFNKFETDINRANAKKAEQLINYDVGEGFKNDVFGNPNLARQVPHDYKPKNGEKVVYLEDYVFNGDKNTGVKTRTPYIVIPEVESQLNRFQKLFTNNEMNKFVSAYDKGMNVWKKMALGNANYHIRNAITNPILMYVAGMNPIDVGKYLATGAKELSDASAISKKVAASGMDSLSDAEKAIYNRYDSFKQNGLKASSQNQQEFSFSSNVQDTVQNQIARKEKGFVQNAKDTVAENGKRVDKTALQGANYVFDKSQQVGSAIDEHARYSMFKYYLDKGQTAEEAAKNVNKYLYNYGDLTAFDKGVKRVLPFYTFMKKNAANMVSSFVNDPSKFANIEKARQMTLGYSGMDSHNLQDYQNDNGYFGWGGDGQGNGKLVKANLPTSDVTKWMTNPLDMLISGLTPVAKTPLEMGTNHNFFTKRAIEDFHGQTKPFAGVNMPVMDQYALSQAVPLRASSILADQTKKGSDLNKAYDQLKALEDLMKVYKQQTGARPKTLQQLGL